MWPISIEVGIWNSRRISATTQITEKHSSEDARVVGDAYHRNLGVSSLILWAMKYMKFAFRAAGRDHEAGDGSCIGCAAMEGKRFPRPHNNYKGVKCLGLVHAEKFEDPAKTVYMCDACNANPRLELLD